jgi:hypothetical protein
VTRAPAALLIGCALIPLAAGSGARAVPVRQGVVPPRQAVAVLFVVDWVSFEELMSIPQIAEVARIGGAALMASSPADRKDPVKAYRALGSGVEAASGSTNALSSALCAHGVSYRLDQMSSPRRTRLIDAQIRVLLGDVPCSSGSQRMFIVEWMLTAADSEAATSAGDRATVLADLGRRIDSESRGMEADRKLFIVVSPTPSSDMTRRGDEVSPMVLGIGRNGGPIPTADSPRALRSDTTRQTGLVANVDVAPTILDFFGIPIPSEMDGQPIEFTDEPAPFKLHRLHLEQRRIRLPIQLAEVAFVAASGAVAIVVLLILARRRRLPNRIAESMRFLTLCVAALPIPLMLGGLLPGLTYWVVVPFLVITVVGLAVLARFARLPGAMGPFVFLGLVGFAVVLVDALLGWRGARIPLIGGTMFDGARFYGIPNALLCLPLASALFVAAALPAFTGLLLLVATALFAGFPSLGADIGGAITIFFAAGLWWVLRTRRRFGVREVAVVVGVTVLGLGSVLLANRYLPGPPTHATRFVERTGGGLSDRVHAYTDRLRVGIDQIKDVPAALIPLVGLFVVLALTLARPGPIGGGLDRAGRRWRQIVIVLCLAGVVSFLANDTGVAAAAPIFLYAMSAMAYPAFLVASDRQDRNGDVS